MKQRVLSLFIALLGIAAGAQAQSANSVYVGTQSLSDGTYTSSDLTALTEGSITYDSSQGLLTLNNAVINNESGNGLRITVPDLTVKLKGDSYINTSGYGLDLYSSVTIDGKGREYLDNLTIKSKSSGIHFYNSSLTLTISNGAKVYAEGTEYGIVGKSGRPDKLAMTDKYTQLHIKGGTACIKNMDLSDGPQKHGFFIYRPKGAKYQAGTQTIVDADGNEVKGQWVIFKNITIDAENFPDENFRNYILDQEYGKDGILSDEEIASVKEITVFGMGIQDLKGIEFFRALEDLNCNNNQLTSLNVSENTAMVNLFCTNNQLTSIDLSKNTDLIGFACENNKLTTLDVSNNASLTYLYCNNNQLTSLDVSQNTLLIYLECYGNKIRGAEMDALVNSLPKLTDWGTIRVYKDEAPDGNEITPTQVVTAKAKHWNVKWWGEVADGSSDWIDYEFVSIDETNFPDENFRNYILAQDYGKDGYLTDTEIAAVKSIDVSNKNIADLKGIEFFTALEKLWCNDNQLTELDLSQNTALKELRCQKNKLTSLDLSQNTKLTFLDCGSNLLTALDLSQNRDLKTLLCNSNQLASLDALNVSNNTELTYLACYNNQLAGLDVSNNTALTKLYCRDNQLTTLDFSKNTKMEDLDCSGNQLTALDVSNNTALTELDCYNNQLATLYVSGCTQLTKLQCYNNKLTALDVSDNIALISIYCYQNEIRGAEMDAFVESLFDRRHSSSEGYLYIYNKETPTGNKMDAQQVVAAKEKNWRAMKVVGATWEDYGSESVVTIDETTFPDENFRNWILAQDYGKDGYLNDIEIAVVKNIHVHSKEIANLQGIGFFTALTDLDCSENQLTALDVSNNTALTKLDCYGNQLTALDVSNNTALTDLVCSKNQLTALDVSNNTALTDLNCYENQLTALDVSNNTALKYLHCDENKLASLDLSKNTALYNLECSLNQLTSLDVSNNTALEQLVCNHNQLASLDVSKNTHLVMLVCTINQLTSLDVSKNTELEELHCSNNLLTSLDVSNNLKLEIISCYENAIRVKDMDAFVKSLPDVRETGGYLVVYSDVVYEGYEERNEMTPAQVAAAKDNGWIVQKIVMTDEGPDLADFEGVRVKGDLNDDDEVNIADVVILSNAILAGSTDLMFDINGDNKVDANDITAIVDIIATR